jgi:DNA-binding transcriptional regulator LsrR (DeoR family)
MTPEQRQLNAERLLKDPTLREALDVLKQAQIAVFTARTSSEDDVMEARRMVRALGDLETQLSRFILDGKLAERRK